MNDVTKVGEGDTMYVVVNKRPFCMIVGPAVNLEVCVTSFMDVP